MCGTLRRRMLLSVNGFTEPLRVPPVWRYCHVCVRTGQAQEAVTPCRPSRARHLLGSGQAVVHKRFPPHHPSQGTGRRKKRYQTCPCQGRPGRPVHRIAIVREDGQGGPRLIAGIELEHRGECYTRQHDEAGGLPPETAEREHPLSCPEIRQQAKTGRPVSAEPAAPDRHDRLVDAAAYTHSACLRFSVESVKFDTQKMLDPEVSGKEYQQGELEGYEVREYLLEKWCPQVRLLQCRGLRCRWSTSYREREAVRTGCRT